MRVAALAAISALSLIACSQAAPTAAVGSPSAGATVSAASSPPASPSPHPSPPPDTATSSYGLLIVDGVLEMVDAGGRIAAKAPLAPSSVQDCSAGLALTQKPPVSASNDKVYFRDGDTKIRFLTFDGQTGDATTVPGGPTTVSFFAVSPDDRTIAVLVENLGPDSTIGLQLYVEDLNGGANHSVLYSTSTSRDRAGITLWPMGWHQGGVVFSISPACSDDQANVAPSEWHIADVSTGTWVASLGGKVCRMSRWPSSGGVVCVDIDPTSPDYGTYSGYDWTGRVRAIGPGLGWNASGFGPVGDEVFTASTTAPSTRVQISGQFGVSVGASGRAACLWIDGSTLLAPDALISLGSPPNPVVLAATTLPQRGICAGSYPGDL